MSKEQFRKNMGLLGIDSNPFIANRIFEVVDTDKDHHINFVEFVTIMDTMLHGEQDEKYEYSFALFDIYDSGYFAFEEFKESISKFIAHFNSMTGSHAKVDTEFLQEIFEKMDSNKDGLVYEDEFKEALRQDPGLFQWFELLN
jgi:Ca2+-binding EF-hand superfamily protein